MSHSPIASLLKKMFSDALSNDPQSKELFCRNLESRRKFLRDTAYTAGGLLAAPALFRHRNPDQDSSQRREVAIVGGGMAGLNACYQLGKMGVRSRIYEASGRTGGRMYTLKDAFWPGLTTDVGGEFVDTSHAEILHLVKELGLELYDLRKDRLLPKELYFGGAHLSNRDLISAFKPHIKQLVMDIGSLPHSINYKTGASLSRLDNLSITEYLRSIGIRGWLYDFIQVVLTREYGMESSEQSAINFLIMFTPPAAAGSYYEMFGDDHEVYKIKGGSQHLVDTLYDKVKDHVTLGKKLVSISTLPAGGYALSFENGKTPSVIEADQVLLTLPFTVLRKIQLNVPMPAEKRKCIDELGYGNSCKFIMGFNGKPWRDAGRQGYTFTDISFGCGWDSTQSQSDKQGSFTVFGGGDFGERILNTRNEDLSGEFVQGLETIYPGAKLAYNHKNISYYWRQNPFSLAGYSAYRKGQCSRLAGWEGVPVGNIHFVGEHVSRDFQGYMNGAAQTGRQAAASIALALKRGHIIKHAGSGSQ